MKKMLFITAFPPNNKSGGQVFSLNSIKDLSKKYTIDLIYFSYKDHFPAQNMPINSIKKFKINNFNCLRNVTLHPVFARRFNKNILSYLNDRVSGYDIVFLDHMQVGIYSMYLKHPLKVIRSHDIFFQKFSRKNSIFKYWIKLTEEKILRSAQKIFVLSEKDANIVKSIYNLNVCFTHDYIQDFYFSEFFQKNNIFIFFGLWSRKENLDGLLWFIKNVLPLIDRNLNVGFSVIGGGLSEKIRKKYLMPWGIEYFGFVDYPLNMIYTSQALIAPLFAGAGIKVKVIDAFTTGTPVIGTDITFEGLPFIEGLVYLAKKPMEYANIINNFVRIDYAEKKKKAGMFRLIYDTRHLSELL
jgi:glycosyltransferase involved in cell wall biosynthesis